MAKSLPDWYLQLDMPHRLRTKLEANFTPHRDGWVIWYKGATRFVCGRKTPPAEVEGKWEEKRDEIDNATAPRVRMGDTTVRILMGSYIERQRRRVATGRPKPLSPFTLEDHIRTLRAFAKHVGPDRVVGELTPDDFQSYAATFDERAASTAARNIAYVKSMFTWGEKAELCEEPSMGPDFVKPPVEVTRDERLEKTKSYTPEEIKKIWGVARRHERLWIALGINCAFDNSDISQLTWEVVDLKAGVIDYRRRKKGRVRRVVPLTKRTLKLLMAYQKITGGKEGPVFQSADGHSLVRMRSKADGRATPIDAIARRWTILLQRAGIRPRPKRITLESGKRKLEWTGTGERRGFRGLRTTFANNVPPGYGDERQIVMGHSHGTTFLDNYLERVGMDRLREMVESVWSSIFKGPQPPGPRPQTSGRAGGPSTP